MHGAGACRRRQPILHSPTLQEAGRCNSTGSTMAGRCPGRGAPAQRPGPKPRGVCVCTSTPCPALTLTRPCLALRITTLALHIIMACRAVQGSAALRQQMPASCQCHRCPSRVAVTALCACCAQAQPLHPPSPRPTHMAWHTHASTRPHCITTDQVRLHQLVLGLQPPPLECARAHRVAGRQHGRRWQQEGGQHHRLNQHPKATAPSSSPTPSHEGFTCHCAAYTCPPPHPGARHHPGGGKSPTTEAYASPAALRFCICPHAAPPPSLPPHSPPQHGGTRPNTRTTSPPPRPPKIHTHTRPPRTTCSLRLRSGSSASHDSLGSVCCRLMLKAAGGSYEEGTSVAESRTWERGRRQAGRRAGQAGRRSSQGVRVLCGGGGGGGVCL